MKKYIAALITLLLLILSICGCTEQKTITESTLPPDKSRYDLILHFIDVGQGDCTLIESHGHFALIDGGEYSERNKVISYLSSQGVENLDYIISTHPHSDHCGSLSEVIRNFDTDTLICPDAPYTSSWEYVMDAADERDVTYETPKPFDVYKLGSATITVLSPSKDAVYSNLNDYSIVTMIEYGNTSALLTGDAERVVEKELVNSTYDLSADILKCGHHGSSSSSCSEFLDNVSPGAAIISCGKDNDYGHPHTETITALKYRNIPYWQTDTTGTIVAFSDGENFYISTSSSTTSQVVSTENNYQSTYIGNKNSKIFHAPTCSSVTTMKEENKVTFTSYKDAADSGYRPCGKCNP